MTQLHHYFGEAVYGSTAVLWGVATWQCHRFDRKEGNIIIIIMVLIVIIVIIIIIIIIKINILVGQSAM